MIRFAFVLAAAALLADLEPLAARQWSFGVGAGAALPMGGTAERWEVGPSMALSVESRRGLTQAIRLDVEWARLVEPGRPYRGNLRSYGASLNGVLRWPRDLLTLYVVAGAGAYRLQRMNQWKNPYGTTAAVQAGLGLEVGAWRIRPWVEARPMLHLTDYAAGEFAPSGYLPLLVGVRVR